jgi:hypothetical protein
MIEADKLFFVLIVSAVHDEFEEIYTLEGTHYGRLLPIFRLNGELENFKRYAQQNIKSEYKIKTFIIVAESLEQVHRELEMRNLVPSGPSRVAVEGTSFFDEVFAQLMTDTLWGDSDR